MEDIIRKPVDRNFSKKKSMRDYDEQKAHYKKEKKKKSKKHKKHKRHYSSDSQSSSDEVWVEKGEKERSQKIVTDERRSKREELSGSSSDEVGVEKNKKNVKELEENETRAKRDEWMSGSSCFLPTITRPEKRKEKSDNTTNSIDSYNPSTSSRELNPYWKGGGDGLPSLQRSKHFQKPAAHDDDRSYKSDRYSSAPRTSSGWKRESVSYRNKDIPESQQSVQSTDSPLNNKEINELAAKLIKAEILGNLKLVADLKAKLEKANQFRSENPQQMQKSNEEEVLLLTTNSKGMSRPVCKGDDSNYGKKNKKRQKLDTHLNGERIRHFEDDDKYSLKEMFEREKCTTREDFNSTILKLGKEAKNPNDDLDDIFADRIRESSSNKNIDERNRNAAIREHNNLSKSLANCPRCVDSATSLAPLIVSLGEKVYLSLPPYESLTPGHCLLAPIRHTPCATQLDEDVWSELEIFRKAVCRMFIAHKFVTVFVESAINLNNHPHMVIECIPIPEDDGALVPMYFKKAILECEREWSDNKKLIELKGRTVRQAIPKGLPYFSVGFDSDPGFAHVVEDRRYFPRNFAQEIIGGILDLDHSKWRKPKMEQFEKHKQKVKDFKQMWSDYDCTK